MISMKLMKWVAAGALAGAPAIGMARAHHITTAAAPLAAVTVTPKAAVNHATSKLGTAKHRKVSVHRAVTRKLVKHAAKPKITHKHRAKVKSHKR